MQVVVIYPGRFQPFGPHHASVYIYLRSFFSPWPVFISTSNKTDIDSPFNFHEKVEFISKYVPMSNIVQCTSPYKSTEILNDYDPESTIAIFAYSSKDAGRIAYTKANNEPGYFQPFISIEQCESFKKHGYIIIVPKFSKIYNGKEISGTFLREFILGLSKMKDQNDAFNKFKKMFKITNKQFYLQTIKKFV